MVKVTDVVLELHNTIIKAITQCIELFNILPTTPSYKWFIAADWIQEEQDIETTANAFREGIFVLGVIEDIHGNRLGFGDGSGYGNGAGYGFSAGDGDAFKFGYGAGSGAGNGNGRGNGVGSGCGNGHCNSSIEHIG